MKFRIYNKSFKKFVTDPYEWLIGLDGNVYFLYSDGSLCEFEDCVVQQATGIKDKNGVMIFEGDIVSCEDGTSEVCWLGHGWSAKSRQGNNMFIWNDLEITGNIFNND